jgi:hypothetical protein
MQWMMANYAAQVSVGRAALVAIDEKDDVNYIYHVIVSLI